MRAGIELMEEQRSMGQHSRGPGSTGSGICSQYPKENPQTVLRFGHRESLAPFSPCAHENL